MRMLQPEVHAAVTPGRGGGRQPGRRAATWRSSGGGASGTLTAIHLMASRAHDLHRHRARRDRASSARGWPTAPPTARHLLNVRSRHMSAFPDIPGDLVEWARRTGRQPDAQAFLPRRDYAVYLRETLDRLRDERFAFRAERVLDVVPGGRRLRAARRRVAGSPARRRCVLAHGNQRPAPLALDGVPLPEARWHLPDPWDLDRLDGAAARRRGRPRRHRAHRGRRRDHAAGRRAPTAGW